MQGRLLENDKVTGWEKRQPKKEDGASERAKAWREAKKKESEQQENEGERNRTQPNAKKRPDTDKEEDKENKEKIIKKEKPKTKLDAKDLEEDGVSEQETEEFFAIRKEKKASILTPTEWKAIKREAQKLGWTPKQAVLKCIAKGWRGFEAQWVLNDEQNNARASPPKQQRESLREKDYSFGVQEDGTTQF